MQMYIRDIKVLLIRDRIICGTCDSSLQEELLREKTSNPKGMNQRTRAAELSRERSKTTATFAVHSRVQERGKRGMSL